MRRKFLRGGTLVSEYLVTQSEVRWTKKAWPTLVVEFTATGLIYRQYFLQICGRFSSNERKCEK